MFSILDRYIGKTIFNIIMMTLCILVSLSGIIKFIDELRKVGQGSYSILGAGLYTILSGPKDIEVFFPMAALLGTIMGLGIFANYSELLAMQASGFSYLQVAYSLIKTAIPLVLITMAIGEFLAPISEQTARNYRYQMIYGSSILTIQNGLWIKDGSDFIFIRQVVDNGKLHGVNIYHFNKAQQLQILRYAESATFRNGIWTLYQVDESDFRDATKIISKKIVNSEWQTTLTPDTLWKITLKPDSLSISELYKYIKYLKQSEQESDRYQLNMWGKIFSPLSVVMMIMIALSLIFGPLSSVPMGVRIVTGIGLDFLFYILGQIFGSLSLVYNISPIFGAAFPSIVFLIISIVVLLQYTE